MWKLGQQPAQAVQIGAHDAPVKSVGFLSASNIVVSGSWDRTLKFWDMRTPNPAATFDMPERVYAMDVRDGLMVVATAARHILAYDVTGQPREVARKESPLKFQSRCISCFPDATGFAVGSIEGRVGIHYLTKVAVSNFGMAVHLEFHSSACISLSHPGFHQICRGKRVLPSSVTVKIRMFIRSMRSLFKNSLEPLPPWYVSFLLFSVRTLIDCLSHDIFF